jgi:integrase
VNPTANPDGDGAKKRRARGEGSYFQRGRIWWIKFFVGGRPVRESTESTKHSDAVKLLKKRLAEVSTGRFAPDADRVTAADLLAMLEADAAAKGNRSRPKLGHICEAFDVTVTKAADGAPTYAGGWRATALTTDRIRSYEADRLKAGAARATVNQELAALRRAFNLAVEAGRLATKPVIKTPDPKNARKGFFEPADLALMLTHLPEYLHPVVRFAYLTGWRIRSEVLPLRWTQVDFQAGTVRLEQNTTKSGEGRTFPFGVLPDLKAVLDEQRARTSALVSATGEAIPWVFHRHGAPLTSHDLYDAWKAARKAAGLAESIPHDFRRTAVRNLERAGVSRSVAMKLTGHKTENVYRRYAIVAEADLREGVEKLAKLGTLQSTG